MSKEISRRRFLKKLGISTIALSSFPKFSFAKSSPSYEGESIRVVAFLLSGIKGIKERIPEFEEKYNISVTFSIMEMGAARQKMMVDFSSGAGTVDVGMNSIHIAPNYLKRDLLEPIDRFIGSDLAEPELLDLSDFSETALDNVTFRSDVLSGPKKKWGLPHDLLCQGHLYRKSLYEKYGLTKPGSLEEYLNNARVITENESPDTYGLGWRGKRGPQLLWTWTQIFRAMGGRFFKDYPDNLTPTLFNDTTVEAIKYFVNSFEFAPSGAKSWAYTELLSEMENGTVAQTLDDFMFSKWLEDPEKSVAPKDWDYGVIPLKEGLTYKDVAFGPSVAMSNFWCINRDISEARKQASWKFIQWATSKPLLDDLCKTGKMKGVLTRDSMYEICKDERWAQAHKKAQQHASKYFRPKLPEWSQFSSELALNLSKAVLGSLTPEQAAKKTQKSFEDIAKEAGYIQ